LSGLQLGVLASLVGSMFALCLLLALTGVVSFVSGHELLINGANLAISVVTLMLLPILQATQNRDGAALQAKIDELIKATGEARDDLIGLENRSKEEIEHIRLDEGQRAKATGKRGDTTQRSSRVGRSPGKKTP
jgi:low affinity Fe/Cu permease